MRWSYPPVPHAGHGQPPALPSVRDAVTIAGRGLRHMVRQPESLADATVQPIMFVLLFAFVFGGAIQVPGGGSYREFLMGGILAQATGFAAVGVAMSLAIDRQNQVVDRFRSLPIRMGSVLAGHAVANLVKALMPIVLMSICGVLIGWRIRSSFPEAAVGYLLLIGFSFAMIWVGILLGSLIRSPEGVQGVGFAVLFPITFLASTFVPTDTMPPGVRTVAEWNPVTALANAVRIQFGNPVSAALDGAAWPVAHPFAYSLMAMAVIVLVCAPAAVRAYGRTLGD